jgi:ATP-dependent DNA ligase
MMINYIAAYAGVYACPSRLHQAGNPYSYARATLRKRLDHEIKHDGYRTLIVIDHGKVRAFSRHGRDWTGPYHRVVEAAAKLPCKAALIVESSSSKTGTASLISTRCARRSKRPGIGL